MKKLAAIHRTRINKMAHAAGQAVAKRLKRRWTTAMERLLDEGAGYADLVLYLDARSTNMSLPEEQEGNVWES
jgi:hypothetical protein